MKPCSLGCAVEPRTEEPALELVLVLELELEDEGEESSDLSAPFDVPAPAATGSVGTSGSSADVP